MLQFAQLDSKTACEVAFQTACSRHVPRSSEHELRHRRVAASARSPQVASTQFASFVNATETQKPISHWQTPSSTLVPLLAARATHVSSVDRHTSNAASYDDAHASHVAGLGEGLADGLGSRH